MKKIKIISKVLFWTTLISPMFSFALAGLVGEIGIFGEAGLIRYSWLMWLFIPLGVLSILIGKKLKQNKLNYKENYIVAFACLPILIILGSVRFISSEFSYNINEVTIIENIVKLDLPNRVKIATHKLDSYDTSYVKIVDKKDKENFESELEANKLWKKDLSSKIKSLLPYDIQFELEDFDYYVFYNLSSDEYNVFPPDGEYECIFIAYDSELQRLIILDDYKINLN